MTIKEELQSRNFSIYGQWIGVVDIVICFAIGLGNIWWPDPGIIIFAAICLAYSPVILFIEVPFLMRICPTSARFDAFINNFTTNYMRALVYVIMSAAQWASIALHPTPLIVAAFFLLLAGLCYLIAGLKGQGFIGSKTLGGQGVAEMIV